MQLGRVPFTKYAYGHKAAIGCHPHKGKGSVQGNTILNLQSLAVDTELRTDVYHHTAIRQRPEVLPVVAHLPVNGVGDPVCLRIYESSTDYADRRARPWRIP